MNLDEIDRAVRAELDAKHAARERALAHTRELVRLCATCIRAVHRHERDRARTLLAEARALCRAMAHDLQEHQDLYYQGYVQDAEKELVEASVVVAVTGGGPLPTPASLGVAAAPFLNGLGEAVGELRRYVLDKLRRDDLEGCEALLDTMDEIYSLLVTMDYPEAITGGLRRTTDSVRGILERTRGDLTSALRQRALRDSLRALEERLGAPPSPAPEFVEVGEE